MGSSKNRIPKSVYFFCDESHTIDCNFMGIGGLAIPDFRLLEISNEIEAIKKRNEFPNEVKWSKVNSRRNCPHTELVHYLKKLIDEGKAKLHLRFVPMAQFSHPNSPTKRRDINSIIGKQHDALLLHRALRLHAKNSTLHIRPDSGTCTEKLVKLKSSLTARAESRYGQLAGGIASIELRDSKYEPVLQMLDVSLGGLTALKNKSSPAREAKTKIMRELVKIYGEGFVDTDTPRGQVTGPITVWNSKPLV